MKALTVRNPWVELQRLGSKRGEIRGRQTHYRGPLILHAGMAKAVHYVGLDPMMFHYGALVAVVSIVDCIYLPGVARGELCASVTDLERSFGDWFYEFGGCVALGRPVPMSGRQGLWECPAATIDNAGPNRMVWGVSPFPVRTNRAGDARWMNPKTGKVVEFPRGSL